MSLDAMFDTLVAELRTLVVPNQITTPNVVYPIQDQIGDGDLPAILPMVMPNTDMPISELAFGHAKELTLVRVVVLLGLRQAGLENIYPLIHPWADAMARLLFNHVQLNGAATLIGYPDDRILMWRWMPDYKWADGFYSALQFSFFLMECPITNTNP